ncbi:MAG: LysE family transporter [Candidatus Nanopelagicales bacterium]
MEALLAGLALGLGSGVAPGPLLVLVVSATLRGGFPAGLRVALAPLLTDVPIILLSLTVLSALPDRALAALGVVGGVVVGWFGVDSLRAARGADPATEAAAAAPLSTSSALRQGALANVTNPAPWLFWLTAGGTVLVAAWRESPGDAVAFLVGFYLMLVGVKVLLAWGVAAGRHRLSARHYRVILAGSGVLLLVFGAVLAVRGALAW